MHETDGIKKKGYPNPRNEELLGNKVYLELWVKVEKDWRKRKSNLQEYGYRDTDYRD